MAPLQPFPPIPAPPPGQIWPAEVHEGYHVLSDAYGRSRQLLRLEDGDPIRLRLHSERITQRVLPVAEHLTNRIQDQHWSQLCMATLQSLIDELDRAAASVDTR